MRKYKMQIIYTKPMVYDSPTFFAENTEQAEKMAAHYFRDKYGDIPTIQSCKETTS